MDHTCNDYWLTRLSVCWYSYGYWLTSLSVCWYSYDYWLTRLSVCWYSYGYWLTRLSVCWYSYDYWLTRLFVCWYSYLCLHARLGVACSQVRRVTHVPSRSSNSVSHLCYWTSTCYSNLPHVCSCEVIKNMDLLNGHLSLEKYYTTCRK